MKRPRALLNHGHIAHGGKNAIGNMAQSTSNHILDFSANISPLGCPDQVLDVLQDNLVNIVDYPDPNSSELSNALSKYLKLDSKNIVVGNGATEIIYNFCNAFLAKSRVLIPVPTFQEYERAAALANAHISKFITMDISDDLDLFISNIPKHGCVFVCNPNNPTGTIVSQRKMLDIVNAANSLSTLVFVDECFIELSGQERVSVIKYTKTFENLVVLRSLTKSFGLPGIRIGYAAASEHIIDILTRIKIPWSVNTLAQISAISSLKCRDHIKMSRKVITKEYEYLHKKINAIPGFCCYESTTNFILVGTTLDSTYIQQQLLRSNILVRDCKNFEGLSKNCIRIAIRTHKDNLKLVHALEKIQ